MRIAWFQVYEARRGAICIAELFQSFVEAGHSGRIYAPSFDDSFPFSIQSVLPSMGLESREWWESAKIDLAIFYRIETFTPNVLKAAKDAGVVVCIESDSDGYVSPLQNFWRGLSIRFDRRLPILHQIKSWKAFLNEWSCGWRKEKTLFRSLEEADFVVIESTRPGVILSDFLVLRGRLDLARKIRIIPFAVCSEFTDATHLQSKQPRIIVAGRLNAAQKDPYSLKLLLLQLASQMPSVEIELHVRGCSDGFKELSDQHSNISLYADSSKEYISSRFAVSQIVVSTSLWETTPIVGLEALCMGCTIVAPQSVPGYQSLIGDGEFGTAYVSKRGAFDAVASELNRWRQRSRDPIAISNHWRTICNLASVANQYVELHSEQNASNFITGRRSRSLPSS